MCIASLILIWSLVSRKRGKFFRGASFRGVNFPATLEWLFVTLLIILISGVTPPNIVLLSQAISSQMLGQTHRLTERQTN